VWPGVCVLACFTTLMKRCSRSSAAGAAWPGSHGPPARYPSTWTSTMDFNQEFPIVLGSQACVATVLAGAAWKCYACRQHERHQHDGVWRRRGAAIAQVRRQEVQRPGRLPTPARAAAETHTFFPCGLLSPLPRAEGARRQQRGHRVDHRLRVWRYRGLRTESDAEVAAMVALQQRPAYCPGQVVTSRGSAAVVACVAERAVAPPGGGAAQAAAASSRSESRASQPTRPPCSTASDAAASNATSRRIAGCGPEDPQNMCSMGLTSKQLCAHGRAVACELATGELAAI
jgi:hypothetical protein